MRAYQRGDRDHEQRHENNLIDAEHEGEVLQHLNDDIQADFLKSMDMEELLQATENLDTDNLADILQQLPKNVLREVLHSMNQQDRERVEDVLQYPENTAGGGQSLAASSAMGSLMPCVW